MPTKLVRTEYHHYVTIICNHEKYTYRYYHHSPFYNHTASQGLILHNFPVQYKSIVLISLLFTMS